MDRRAMLKAMATLGLLGITPFVKNAASATSSKLKLFVNGNIYQDATTRVKNILVKDDLVMAVNITPSAYKHAELIDLAGGALYPGFCDSYVHLVEAGLGFSGADLEGKNTPDAIVQGVAAALAKHGGLRNVHTLIHLAFPRPDQIKRITDFKGKVVTTVQPGFWQVETGMERYYGDHNKASYPMKDLFEAGIPTGLSTDFFVSPLPLAPPTKVMNIAMVGGGPDRKPLTMQELITGYSQGSAATTGKKDVGTLYPGKKADMVLYEHDLFAIQPEDFSAHDPKVMGTWVSGRMVYDVKAQQTKTS